MFDVYCTKGTYIRKLVHDMGKKIGCGATMVDLIRLKNGNFDIKDSIELYGFLKLSFEEMKGKLISIDEYYKDLKKVYLLELDYKKILNGLKIECDEQDKMVRIYNNNKYVGLGEIKDKFLKRYIIQSQ
jgi:tRNA pseudouridine55 synthase